MAKINTSSINMSYLLNKAYFDWLMIIQQMVNIVLNNGILKQLFFAEKKPFLII